MPQSQNLKPVTRRSLIQHGVKAAAVMAAQAALPAWMPRVAFSKNTLKGDVLICIFLRGGADGLNIIVPHGEDAYYRARPNIGYKRPDDKRAVALNSTLDLDGFFGISYGGYPLLPIFQAGQITAVHAVGSPNTSRSHFDAMAYMEYGSAPGEKQVYTGWLARHLTTSGLNDQSFIRAVAFGDSMPQSLFGTMNALSLQSIMDYHLPGDTDRMNEMLAMLNGFYNGTDATLKSAADQVAILNKLDISKYRPARGAVYNRESLFHLALQQTSALMKAEVGLEVAAIDLGGWDTHQDENDQLYDLLLEMSTGLAAFHTDIGDLINSTTVVVMSEFGRRIDENGSRGTDHGHGNVMMVMGGNVARQPVIADWPGLHPDQLIHGDLNMTADYRDVLAEVLTVRVGNTTLDQVFPGYVPTLRGVVRP